MDLSVTIEKLDNVTIAVLKGNLDVISAPSAKHALKIHANSDPLIIDLDLVDMLDSHGLGVLIWCAKTAGVHHGVIGIVSSKKQIRRIFEVAGLRGIMALFDRRADAARWANSSALI